MTRLSRTWSGLRDRRSAPWKSRALDVDGKGVSVSEKGNRILGTPPCPSPIGLRLSTLRLSSYHGRAPHSWSAIGDTNNSDNDTLDETSPPLRCDSSSTLCTDRDGRSTGGKVCTLGTDLPGTTTPPTPNHGLGGWDVERSKSTSSRGNDNLNVEDVRSCSTAGEARGRRRHPGEPHLHLLTHCLTPTSTEPTSPRFCL